MSLRKNTLWNLAGSGLPLIAAVALMRFMQQRQGIDFVTVRSQIWDLGFGYSLGLSLYKIDYYE